MGLRSAIKVLPRPQDINQSTRQKAPLFDVFSYIFLPHFSSDGLSFGKPLAYIMIDTVITSFPNAWEREEKQTEGLKQKSGQKIKPYGLKRRLDEEIKFNKTRPAIQSVDHLVHLIMKLSVDFLRRDAPGGIRFQDAFQSSINNIVRERLRILYEMR